MCLWRPNSLQRHYYDFCFNLSPVFMCTLCIFHVFILLWLLSFGVLSVNHLNIIRNISHSLPIPTCSFTQIWDLALHSGRRVSECFGVCVSVEPVECCVHDRLFFPHSAGSEEWAAVELRTLIPFTTVGVNHRVRAKCCWALLLWKGPLSRVSFQVSAERDTTESHGQLVSVCVCMCGPVYSLV